MPFREALAASVLALPCWLTGLGEARAPEWRPAAQASESRPAAQEGGRQTLQELLARLKSLRDDRQGKLRGKVDAVLRTMETEAQTHRLTGLAEQKNRLIALGPECAPLLVELIDPGAEATDTAKLIASYVAQALVEQPSPAIAARLAEIARNGTEQGKLNAAKALAACPESPSTNAALAEIFRTSQGELRRVALAGIARVGGPENEKVIAAALTAGDTEAVRFALDALATARAAAFAPKVLTLLQATRSATPYVDALVAYYRACPDVVDKPTLVALVRLAGEVSVDGERRGRVLELLPRFSDQFDSDVKKELRNLSTSPTREVREGALVTLFLAGDKSARKDLIEDYDEQIERNPQWPASWEARGNVYYRIGQYREAIHDFQKSLSLSATDFRARTEGCYVGIARCYAQQGKLKEAAASLEKAPIAAKDLAALAKEPVFQKLVEHARYGKVFHTE